MFSWVSIIVLVIGLLCLVYTQFSQGLGSLSKYKDKNIKNHMKQHVLINNLLIASFISLLIVLKQFAISLNISLYGLITNFDSIKIMFFILGVTLVKTQIHLNKELIKDNKW